MIIEQALLNQFHSVRDVPQPPRGDHGGDEAFGNALDRAARSQPQQPSATSSTAGVDTTSRDPKAPKQGNDQSLGNSRVKADDADAQPASQTPASESSADGNSDADQPAPVTADSGEQSPPVEDQPSDEQPVENVAPTPVAQPVVQQITPIVNPQPVVPHAAVVVNTNQMTTTNSQPRPRTQAATTTEPTLRPVASESTVQPQPQPQVQVKPAAPVQPQRTAQAQPVKPQQPQTQPQIKIQVPQPQPAPNADAQVKSEVVRTAATVKPAPQNPVPAQPQAAQPVQTHKPVVASSTPTPAPVEASEPAARPQPAPTGDGLNLQASPQPSTDNPEDSRQQSSDRQQHPHPHNTPNRAPAVPTVSTIRINEPVQVEVQIEPIVELPSDRPEARQLAARQTTEQPQTSQPNQVPVQSAPVHVDVNIASAEAPAPTTHTTELAPPTPSASNTPAPTAHSHAQSLPTATTDLPEADAARLTDQVSRGLRAALNQRGGTVTLRLSPPDLGVLRIQVRLTQGAVQANFETTTQAVGHLIQRHAASLRQALEAQGLTVERIQVNVQPSNPGSGAQAQSQNDSGSTADGRSRGLMDHHDSKQGAGDQSSRRNPDTRFQRELLDLVA